jgi:hypothetical protein
MALDHPGQLFSNILLMVMEAEAEDKEAEVKESDRIEVRALASTDALQRLEKKLGVRTKSVQGRQSSKEIKPWVLVVDEIDQLLTNGKEFMYVSCHAMLHAMPCHTIPCHAITHAWSNTGTALPVLLVLSAKCNCVLFV